MQRTIDRLKLVFEVQLSSSIDGDRIRSARPVVTFHGDDTPLELDPHDAFLLQVMGYCLGREMENCIETEQFNTDIWRPFQTPYRLMNDERVNEVLRLEKDGAL